MHNEEGCAHTVHLVNWRNLFQKFAVTFKTAVLEFAQLAPPGAGVLKERDEIGDANDIYGCRPQIGVGGYGREHHKATITPSHYYNTLWIGDATFTQPVNGVLQVGHRIHPQAHIVQALILVAIASAATHIWFKYSIPPRNKILN